MKRERKGRQQGQEPLLEIRQGFDGLLGALGDVFSEISDRLESGEAREVHRTFEWDTGKGPVRAEAGVRMRFADAGQGAQAASARAMAQPINPKRSTKEPNETAPVPRPIDFEIVDTGSGWRLTADIPGVDEKELSLTEDGSDLVIATTGKRRYHAVCPMPEGRRVDDLVVSLRNGILEVATRAGDGEQE